MKSLIIHHPFLRFLLIGIINTLFGYSVFACLIFCGLHYTVACFITTIIGAIFNFQTIGRYVFNSANGRLLFRFILVYGMVYVTGISLMKIGNLLCSNLFIVGAMAIILNAPITYWLNKNLVFGRTAI